jgi:hypothetical protein
MALAKTSARDRLNSELHHPVSLTSAFFENWGEGVGRHCENFSQWNGCEYEKL